MALSAFPRRNTSRSRRKAATLEEPTAVEHLNFCTNAAAEDEDTALGGWTAVDLDPDMMWPPTGSVGLGTNFTGPVMPICAPLSAPQLAFLSSGLPQSRYTARDDNCESERNFKRSDTSFSEQQSAWPESYQVLGEPVSYNMSAAEPVSYTTSKPGTANTPGPVLASMQNEVDDSSHGDALSVPSAASSNIGPSRTPSLSSYSTERSPNRNAKAARRMPGCTNCSDTSVYTVSTGLSYGPLFTSQGKQFRGDVMVHEQAILKASLPAYIGGLYGRYVIALTRTTLKQAFGLEFCTAETRDRKLSGIFVSNDIPYLGMSRWDRLLSINGIKPKSVQECLAMLNLELLLVLVLESRGKQSTEPVHKPDMKSLPLRDQRLLTIKKEMLEDNASDFQLRITRRSPKLRLDLPFDAKPSKSNNHGPLLATCDMPHLEILAGDELLSVNGMRSLTQTILAHIMNTASALDLRLSRTIGAGKPAPSEQLGTYEEPNRFCSRQGRRQRRRSA